MDANCNHYRTAETSGNTNRRFTLCKEHVEWRYADSEGYDQTTDQKKLNLEVTTRQTMQFRHSVVLQLMRKKRKVVYFVYFLTTFILLCGFTLTLLSVEVSYILGMRIRSLHYDSVEEDDCLKKIDIAIVTGGFESTFRVVTQIKSILANTQHPVNFHFLVDDISSVILGKLFNTWPIPNIETHQYNISPFINRIEWIPNKHYSGIYGMVKLLVPEILPKSLDKVILLDTDILVVSDISELWSYFSQMNSSHIYSMAENLSAWYTAGSSIRKMWPALRRGFNSGVALVDLGKMRQLKWDNLWREVAIEHLRYTGGTNLADQLGLQSDPSLCTRILEMAKIIHWNSPKKRLNSNSYTEFFNPIYRIYSGMDGGLFSILRKKCSIKKSVVNLSRKTSFDECEMFTKAAGNVYRTHLFVRTFEKQEGPGTISIVSQLSVDRLPLLETLATHWQEPISVAVYGSDEEINNFIDHVSTSEALRQRRNIGIHAVYKQGYESNSFTLYPRLVQIARKFSGKIRNSFNFVLSPKFVYFSFTFTVLPDAFIMHQSHIPSMEITKYRSSAIYRKCVRILKGAFMRDLLNST
uniref:Glycosyltransferase-like protein LARGE1 n=1 Tax=Heterorhabditis bacteriophora TaxID=37862 RepID=A0A1I7WXP0_HETBA